jgi:hypothetical protein
MTTANVYLIEKCGDRRSIFGPYTEASARADAGMRYALVTGRGLENGASILRDELAVAVRTGRVRCIDRIVLA